MRKTKADFIKEAKVIHGNKYDYSKVEYKTTHSKVIIGCKKHGYFEQTPASHKMGRGCPDCGQINRIKSKTFTRERFIEKSIRVHGEKYDYSKVKYTGNHNFVILGCKDHGLFKIEAASHLSGAGCQKCSFDKRGKKSRKILQDFLIKSKKKHGKRYDYSRVEYIRAMDKVTIGCPDHGWFEQRPSDHYRAGCKICSDQTYDTEFFISKAKKNHGDKYDYSRVKYMRAMDKVTIGCPDHGWFDQRASRHISGAGCTLCARASMSINNRKSEDLFLKQAKEVHGNKYDYSKVEYKTARLKILIGCKEHGWFSQSPNKHLLGSACPKCGDDKKRTNIEDFIFKSKKSHKNKYDYSEVIYKNNRTKVNIICPIHGRFKQEPDNHSKGVGCPRCINKSEGKIAEFLEKKNILHRNHKISKERKFFDFYLPEFNILIERDGEQHYKDVAIFSRGTNDYIKKQQDNDRYKTELAKKHGYKLARIPFWLNDKQVEREIDNILAGNPSYPDVPDLKQAETKPLPK
ncbi:endonuclease domain-containing protein [Hyphomicrobiales bacterium]|nr:endonuclease domain-containing protein [Hyphomicrobiales bacterium]